MNYEILGTKAFSYIKFILGKGDIVRTESGAMASMSKDVELKTKLNGGFFSALVLKFLGKESLFINTFSNDSTDSEELIVTQPVPGEIVCQELNGETLYLQPGAYIASSKGISFSINWAGLSSFFAGEGLFRLRVKGNGLVFFGAYGSVVEKEVTGEYIVDSGHLLSYPPGMKLSIKLSGGLFSSFFSGEGLVLKLTGNGKIKLQTRSLGGVASWLNTKFFG
jgi:uncharacterized protein (TIGR00266 family)